MPDIPKIKRNIQKMIDQNAPESDIDAYVASEKVSIEELRVTSAPVAEDFRTAGPPQIDESEQLSPLLTQHPNIAGIVGAGQALGQMAVNLPSDVAEQGLMILEAVRKADETGKGVGKFLSGAINKLIPGEHRNEAMFDAVVAELGKPFQSLEAFSEYAIENPADLAANVGAILTGLGAGPKVVGKVAQIEELAKAGQTLETAGRLIDPISAIASGVGATAGKIKPKNSFVKTALDLPKKKGVELIDDIANAFSNKGLLVNRKSLLKINNDMRKVRQTINGIIDSEVAGGNVRIKTEAVVAALDDLLENAGKEGLELKDMRTVIRMRDDFARQHGAILTKRQVQDIKVGYNKGFKADLDTRFGQVQAKVRDKIRGTIKTELEVIHPELKDLNADLSVMIELRKAIEDRIVAIEKKPIIPVRGLIAGGVAGGVVGGDIASAAKFAGVAVLADKVLTDPNVQIKIADAIHWANLQLAKSGKLSKITRPAFQAGQVVGALEGDATGGLVPAPSTPIGQ